MLVDTLTKRCLRNRLAPCVDNRDLRGVLGQGQCLLQGRISPTHDHYWLRCEKRCIAARAVTDALAAQQGFARHVEFLQRRARCDDDGSRGVFAALTRNAPATVLLAYLVCLRHRELGPGICRLALYGGTQLVPGDALRMPRIRLYPLDAQQVPSEHRSCQNQGLTAESSCRQPRGQAGDAAADDDDFEFTVQCHIPISAGTRLRNARLPAWPQL